MNVQSAYQHWANSYDSVVNPTRDLDARVMREKFANRRFERVLELGCGTGKNTPLLAGIAKELVAMDFSPAMLEIAQAKVQATNLRFVVADLSLPWPLDGARFDLITCNLVLEHVQDMLPVCAQVQQHLAPGGQFFVCELHPAKQYLGSQARFQHQGQEHKIPAYTHHLSDYFKSADQAGLRLMELNEWWDEIGAVPPGPPSVPQSLGHVPRLVSLSFGS